MAFCTGDCLNVLHVDATAPYPGCDGDEDGSLLCPYHTVTEGVDHFHVPIGGVLSIAGGNYPESITIQDPLILLKTPITKGPVIIGE